MNAFQLQALGSSKLVISQKYRHAKGFANPMLGQQYERKAKKKDLSAAEEHTRYVNLLSAVGPEMSQEK